ncbi:response regulator transcription factor [Thermomonas sp.]|jgi:DNA-binding NarL/FixJ family response regulator|uniref:response regulator n=1 Tax=Thermomonas sp. TaxID=1971895 RepID=UPI00239382FB|nr:response regulator transcription factor [Thermomonas sp.]MDE2381061.1 response regulator transcription factor [Xanthomonadaceae bacterium]HOC11450.1 response regulator transcription factor [Thermomonas sp.]HQA02453.1 response regulator transcription factor [Thermomonas sp.]HQE08109.1 response regulator transcription factor [Thermomonas sp.]HQQ58055.1 response regulator transcription factor [Thermomonas sp.]
MTAIPAHALLLEDLPDVTAWLSKLLQARFPGIQVTHAPTLAEGKRLLQSAAPAQLALVDLGLPDGDGTTLIRPLAQQWPDCTIVVTTLFGDDAHVFPALRAGAQGYLLKDQPEERLAAALDGILRGEPALSPAIAQRLLRAFQPIAGGDSAPGVEVLTPRERDVLVLVSKGCRLPELVERLQISKHTVSDHLKSIYRKLNINSRAEATLEAARLGLVQL